MTAYGRGRKRERERGCSESRQHMQSAPCPLFRRLSAGRDSGFYRAFCEGALTVVGHANGTRVSTVRAKAMSPVKANLGSPSVRSHRACPFFFPAFSWLPSSFFLYSATWLLARASIQRCTCSLLLPALHSPALLACTEEHLCRMAPFVPPHSLADAGYIEPVLLRKCIIRVFAVL